MVEDHPVSYINFEGTIPKGNYGAGKVKIWDKGYFFSIDAKQQKLTDKQAVASINKGKLDFIIKGKKIAGRFALVRIKDDEKNWLIIKQKDEYAEDESEEEEAEQSPVKITSIRAGLDKKEKNFIIPMLASPVAKPFSDEGWIYEIKYDGYRAIAELENEQVRLYSRNGISFAERFAKIKTALAKLSHVAILDGEIAALNKKGMPDFQLLQHYAQNKDVDLVYFVFDLLSLDGNDLKNLPLIDRKKLLKLFLKSNKTIQYSNHVSTAGEEYFKKKIAEGYEGIMAKQKDSVYLPGFRTKNWLKIKAITTQEVIIIGFTEPKGARKYFGSILLAQYDEKKKLKYAGHAGTGFSDTTLKELWNKFLQLKTGESPFNAKIKMKSLCHNKKRKKILVKK